MDESKRIFEEIRGYKARFKERFEIDHCMDGELDTSIAGADGQHNQVTLYPQISDPASISGTNIFYSKLVNSIPELFCRKSDGVYRITNNGDFYYSGQLYNQEYCFCGIKFNNEIYAIFSSYQYAIKIKKSSDMITWTTVHDCGTKNNYMSFMVVGSDKIVAVFTNSLFYSLDGVTWVAANISMYGEIVDFKYINNKYVALLNDQYEYLLYSNDCITWSSQQVDSSKDFFSRIIFLSDVYYIITSEGINKFNTSFVKTFIPFTPVLSTHVTDAVVYNNMIYFITVGNTGSNPLPAIIYRYNPSDDTITKIIEYSGMSVYLKKVGNLYFFKISNITYTTFDFVTFTQLGEGLDYIYYERNKYITYSDVSKKLLVSNDGISWSQKDIGTSYIHDNINHYSYRKNFYSDSNIILSYNGFIKFIQKVS
jgi:hypothetical protein